MSKWDMENTTANGLSYHLFVNERNAVAHHKIDTRRHTHFVTAFENCTDLFHFVNENVYIQRRTRFSHDSRSCQTSQRQTAANIRGKISVG